MKKENVIILVIVTFVVAFVAGAVSGIKFYARQGNDPARQRTVDAGQAAPHAVSAEELNRLEAVVRKEPQNLEALIALGNLYFDANRYGPAIDTYQRALALDPKNADVRTDLGIMYRATKNYDGAIREFREAARSDPTHKNSRFNLGVVLQHDQKDIEGAAAAWQEFLKVEPSGERADMARAELQQLKAPQK